jgi:hypothetical protein
MYALPQDQEIDPLGFLGLRFRLKYYGYATRGLAETFIGAPSQVDTACCLFWGEKEADLAAEVANHRSWRAGVRRIFLPADTAAKDAKRSILALLGAENHDPVGVVYMFCHYGKLPNDEVGFRFGDGNSGDDVISLFDLESIALRAVPLVFANACDTSGEDALHSHRVKDRFFNQGAGAYLGTEAKVPVAMASRFGTALLGLFEGRPEGEEPTLGEAVAQTRMLLWTRYCNIGGLFYALVNEDALQRRATQEAVETLM